MRVKAVQTIFVQQSKIEINGTHDKHDAGLC